MGHQRRAGWKVKTWAAEISKKGDLDPWKREGTGVPQCKYCCEFKKKQKQNFTLSLTSKIQCLRVIEA